MIITYNGVQAVKVQFGDTVLAFDPISRESKHKRPGSFGADIVLVSIDNPDMNGVEQVSRGEKQAFAVTGPGEYEIGGVFIKGLQSKSNFPSTSSRSSLSLRAHPSESKTGQVEKESINTIYCVNLENMNLCFLGALGNANLSGNVISALDGIDILFVPIGGNGVLNPTEAEKLSVSLEPSIIIPIHYDNDSLKKFLKGAGAEDVKPVDKLTIKKKDLEGKEGEIVVLEAQ